MNRSLCARDAALNLNLATRATPGKSAIGVAFTLEVPAKCGEQMRTLGLMGLR